MVFISCSSRLLVLLTLAGGDAVPVARPSSSLAEALELVRVLVDVLELALVEERPKSSEEVVRDELEDVEEPKVVSAEAVALGKLALHCACHPA